MKSSQVTNNKVTSSNTTIYARRRAELMQQMSKDIVIVPTAPVRNRNSDVDYAFRPDSDFYYLTGFNEPEAVLVLCPGRANGEFILFCREKDLERETWDGRRYGLEGVVEHFGADDAFPITDMGDILPRIMEDREKIYTHVGRYPDFDTLILGWLNSIKKNSRAGVHAPYELVDLSHILHEQRLIKQKEEIVLMKQAAKVASAGHIRAMQQCKPGMMEYQVQAELEYEFQRRGSFSPAYPSIVAGGKNACILHYTENNAMLQDGDLLLIDAGAEIDCYASDISRTFPVNGKFSAEQKAVYEIVLTAQQSAFEQCQLGNHWNQPHEAAVKVITEGLLDIGLLDGELNELIELGAYRRFYMHKTGHWLGMDVHDVGDYQIEDSWRELEPGMVFTIEPGIYISAAQDIDSRWHDIGIRIEDDVLIRRNQYEVLTDDVPRKIEDIEALMAS